VATAGVTTRTVVNRTARITTINKVIVMEDITRAINNRTAGAATTIILEVEVVTAVEEAPARTCSPRNRTNG